MSGQAGGGLIGGLLVGAVGRHLPLSRLIGWCAIGFGLGDLAIFNAPAVWPAFAVPLGLIVLVGIVGVGYLTGINTLLQTRVADAYRGRVFGAYGTTGALLGLMGTVLAGALGDRLGVVPVLNVQGAGYVLSGVLALVLLAGANAAVASARERVSVGGPGPS